MFPGINTAISFCLFPQYGRVIWQVLIFIYGEFYSLANTGYLAGGLMLRNMFFAFPPRMAFMNLRVCSNCFRSSFTSRTSTPAPFAMRRRLRAFIRFGFLRSCGVMESIMASVRAIFFSSFSPILMPLMPGIILTIPPRGPRRFICLCCCK